MLLCLSWSLDVVHAQVITFGSDDNEFQIEFVEIGNLGNPDDSTGVNLTERFAHLGSVDYNFQMGKYEISREMVEKANAEADLDISLSRERAFGRPRPEWPATGMRWPGAARFVNWLNSVHGYPDAYNLGGPFGIFQWEDTDPGFDPDNPWRNQLARFVLPTADEWHKAAYYDPSKHDGAGGYWDYPTGSDEEPISVASGTDEGTAVYDMSPNDSPAEIMDAGGLSAYGVMGMGAMPQNMRKRRGIWWMTTSEGRGEVPGKTTPGHCRLQLEDTPEQQAEIMIAGFELPCVIPCFLRVISTRMGWLLPSISIA